jgi:hypothetical protein
MTYPHEPFDETAKTFYGQLFKRWGLGVETERGIFFRGRRIDLVVTCPEAKKNQLQQTLFAYFRKINVLEFKGVNDPLTVADYNRILMRSWGLGGLEVKKKKSKTPKKTKSVTKTEAELQLDEIEDNHPNRLPHHRTVTIVCITRPDKILNQFKSELGFLPTKDSGIYHCNDRIPQWIIHPSELALEPKNYPLLPLARGEKLEQFIALCLEQELWDYLQLTLDLGFLTDPNLLWHKIMEVVQMKPVIHESTWPYIDEFFRAMPEGMWKIPTIREAIEGAVEASKKREQEIGQQLGQQLGQRKGAQRMLLNQLHRKFAPIPESVVQKIESTDNLEQLDDWLTQIMAAESLADIGLLESKKK